MLHGAVLLLFSLLAHHVTSQTTNFTISNIRSNLTSAGIIPSIIPPIQPAFSLPFSFQSTSEDALNLLQPGSDVPLANITDFPSLFVSFTSSSFTKEQINNFTQSLWVVAIVDPDAPSRLNPTVSQILHFFGRDFALSTYTIRSPEDDLTLYRLTSQTKPLVPWAAPDPIPGSGPHRFVVAAYIQPVNISVNLQLAGFDPSKRSNFNLTDLATKSLMGRPVGASWWTSERAANYTIPEGGTSDALGYLARLNLCMIAIMAGLVALGFGLL